MLLYFSLFLDLIIPIITPFIPIIEAFGILALVWIDLVLIITIAPVLVALIWIPQIYDCVFNLGIYHKIRANKSDSYSLCIAGEAFSQKIRKVIGANIIIIFSLYLALAYIYNSFQSATMASCCVNQSIISTSTTSNNISDPVFIPILLSIPTLLLTLRILANPTRNWISDSPKLPGLLSFLSYDVYSKFSTPDSLTIKKIRFFKEQICSLYFSFIVGTLVLLYFSTIYSVFTIKNYNVIMLLETFNPKMDGYSIIFFIFSEVIVILITTIAGEMYLRRYEPIDQI